MHPFGGQSMNRRKYTILLIILILSMPYTYGGCVFVFSTGDIDKNNDPKDDDSSTVFVGSTAQAVIDAANAKDLSAGGIAGSLSFPEASRAGNKSGDPIFSIITSIRLFLFTPGPVRPRGP